jgi:two-component system response regulator RegA
MAKNILILEDDFDLAQSLSQEFSDHGYQPFIACKIDQIPNCLFDFAVVDLRLDHESGLDAIDKLHQISPSCRIVVLSGYGSIATVVEALKRGAINYLPKPADFDKIEQALMGITSTNMHETHIRTLSEIEHEYIEYLLTQNNRNISKTAKQLGLHRQSLQRKLKKYA